MSMNDDITALQSRLTTARRDRDRAEGAYANAKAVAQHARTELQEQFAVDSVQAAQELLAQHTQELEQLVGEITAQLDAIEGR